jgi:predicted metal-dependent hydrolase
MNTRPEIVAKFYELAFRALNGKQKPPEIEVEFYPYIGINHTIRVRGGKVYVRIAEIFQDAPPEAHNALALILVAKLLRKKIPPAAREIYAEFVQNSAIREKSLENKRARGRKIVTSARGEVYDLDEMFERLNRIYFSEKLKKPVLSWSARKTFRRLGHYDAVHETIIISKSLDDKKVPRYVVEYVVFHEMLHVFHPAKIFGGKCFHHTPEFRRDEKKFAHFYEADDWIEQNGKFLKRTARKNKID